MGTELMVAVEKVDTVTGTTDDTKKGTNGDILIASANLDVEWLRKADASYAKGLHKRSCVLKTEAITQCVDIRLPKRRVRASTSAIILAHLCIQVKS